PSDVIISGRDTDVAHARAILGEQLTVTKAYLTWSKEANEIESAGDLGSAADGPSRWARRPARRDRTTAARVDPVVRGVGGAVPSDADGRACAATDAGHRVHENSWLRSRGGGDTGDCRRGREASCRNHA